mgnify:CR=1 FL=1
MKNKKNFMDRKENMTNKKRAEKIKKLLGLNGQDNDTYYRVADVLCDLQHYCDYYRHHEDKKTKLDFNYELDCANEYYESEKR